MLHAHDLRHVGGVEGQGLCRLPLRVLVDELVMGVQPHHPAAVPETAELFVGEVSGHVAKRAAVGVGGDDRAMGQLQYLPKAAVVQVGDVRQHPEVSHSPEGPAAQVRQALGGVLGGPGGEAVFLVPGQHPQPEAQGGQPVQLLRALQALHALNGQEGVQLSLRPGGFRLFRGADQGQPGTLGEFRLGAGEHDLQPVGGALRPGDALPEGLALSPAIPEGQDKALDAAPAQAVQVTSLQHPGFSRQAAAGHIVKQIGMPVKNHKNAPFTPAAGPGRSIVFQDRVK